MNLNLAIEKWRLCSATALIAPPPDVSSNLQLALSAMLQHFENCSFMRHEAQEFLSYSICNAYYSEKAVFKRTCRMVLLKDAPRHANFILSHVLQRVKHMDNETLNLKARVSHYGNEYSQLPALCRNCDTCLPVEVLILLSIEALRKWLRTRIDVGTAILQTGPAIRNLCANPLCESSDRGRVLWLLLTATYVLVRVNTKFQV